MEHKDLIIVGVADFKTGCSPHKIRTNLGSCIGVCVYHGQLKVGGMLHIMMPDSKMELSGKVSKAGKYADTGIDALVTTLMKDHKCSLTGLQAKIFGGAKRLGLSQNIGKENEQAALIKLKEWKIPIAAQCVGGDAGYNIEFDLNTGKVRCRILGQEVKEY